MQYNYDAYKCGLFTRAYLHKAFMRAEAVIDLSSAFEDLFIEEKIRKHIREIFKPHDTH